MKKHIEDIADARRRSPRLRAPLVAAGLLTWFVAAPVVAESTPEVASDSAEEAVSTPATEEAGAPGATDDESTDARRLRHVVARLGYGDDRNVIWERPFRFGASFAAGATFSRVPLALEGEVIAYSGERVSDVSSHIVQLVPWLSLVIGPFGRLSIRPGVGGGLEIWRVAGPSRNLVENGPLVGVRLETRVELSTRVFGLLDARGTIGLNSRYPEPLVGLSIPLGVGYAY